MIEPKQNRLSMPNKGKPNHGGGYLVLWLGTEDCVTISDHIEVRINKIEGKRVTLAIKAPKELHIRRVSKTIK